MKAQDSMVRVPIAAAASSVHRPHLLPNFDDDNRTVVIGSPGGTVVLDCRISMLQDYTVSFNLIYFLQLQPCHMKVIIMKNAALKLCLF